jgi:hypothetical protein
MVGYGEQDPGMQLHPKSHSPFPIRWVEEGRSKSSPSFINPQSPRVMKSKLKNFPGISIDHVLVALLVALVITMVARAQSPAAGEPRDGLPLLETGKDIMP